MKGNKRSRRVKVSADGVGVVSHAGVGLLREMAEYTGLVGGVTKAQIDTYAGADCCIKRRQHCGAGKLPVGLASSAHTHAVLAD